MSEDVPNLVKALNAQALICRSMGSPLNADLLERAAGDWISGGPVRRLMEPWAELDLKGLFDTAAVLRLIASWHELALSGDEPAVTSAYETLNAETIWSAVHGASSDHVDRLSSFMQHEPQTNEVRRSIGLVGGFLEIAKDTGLPLRCFELGASAGLNLSWDRYSYRLGDERWGDPHSRVHLDTDWSGGLPAIAAHLALAERAACDRRPTDLRDLAQRRRLMAYIWADQADRLARAQAAIEVALENDVGVETADALDWTRARVSLARGAVSVIYHSVFWQYMPTQTQEALEGLIRSMGQTATPESPLAWLRMEPPAKTPLMHVTLTLWPGGEDRVLAEAHPHGASVRWLAA